MMQVNTDKEITFKVINKFLMHCMRGKENECWIWTGYKDKFGYGLISTIDGTFLAHRVSYCYFNKLKSTPFQVLHKNECHNPNCVRPDHLYLGTDLENGRDKRLLGNLKNTQLGELNPDNRLTKKEVIEIRLKYKNTNTSYRKLAKEYNVTSTTIYYIIIRKLWKHI